MPSTLTIRQSPDAPSPWVDVGHLKTPLGPVTLDRLGDTTTYKAAGIAAVNALMRADDDRDVFAPPYQVTADSPEHAGRLVAERLRDSLIAAVKDLDELVGALGGTRVVVEDTPAEAAALGG